MLFAFATGASVGSFLNVCIYRIPAGKSVISPPSACDDCGSRLKWYDMIPILSALWLRGRCRMCGARFSVRHAFVELLTGAVFAYIVWARIYIYPGAPFTGYGEALLGGGGSESGVLLADGIWDRFSALISMFGQPRFGIYDFWIALAEALVISSVLIVVTFTDIDHRIIPNKVVAFAALAALGFLVFSGSVPLALNRLASSAVLLLIFFAVSALTKAFGAGDAKLFALLGLYFGWRAVCIVSGCFVLAGIWSVALVALRRASSRTRLPLAPFVALAYILLFPVL